MRCFAPSIFGASAGTRWSLCHIFTRISRAFARYHDENSRALYVSTCRVYRGFEFSPKSIEMEFSSRNAGRQADRDWQMWKITIQESRKDKCIAKVVRANWAGEQKVGLHIFHPRIELLTLFHSLNGNIIKNKLAKITIFHEKYFFESENLR